MQAQKHFWPGAGLTSPRRNDVEKYLICYGADNEFWLCDADDKDHAIEQFLNAEMVSPHEDENREAINHVFRCIEVAL